MLATPSSSFQSQIRQFLIEDAAYEHLAATSVNAPHKMVRGTLKIKSNCLLGGMPYFTGVFTELLGQSFGAEALHLEGKFLELGTEITFAQELPWQVALSGERLALNLLQRVSAIATTTHAYVEAMKGSSIKLLDTRKTTPGLRELEKYASRLGGAHNHRFTQVDAWMIKDNHKALLGGLTGAVAYFKSLKRWYQPVIAEVHSLAEVSQARELGIKHLLLDNFTPEMVKEAVKFKAADTTFELSGGIRLDNIATYLLPGIDAISVGVITQFPMPVDISFKMV